MKMKLLFLIEILASAHAAVLPQVASKSLSYRQVAENTSEIRWYVTPGKKTNVLQTTEDFSYQYEVTVAYTQITSVHAEDTYLTANVTEAFRSYYQVYTYHKDALIGWNDSASPLHVFCRLDQYGSILTPLAKLAWDPEQVSFVEIDQKTKNSSMYVALLLGDSAAGTSHDEIFETLELRRAYVESRLNAHPELASGLNNFIQSGKSLQTSVDGGKVFMDSLQADSPFTYATFWEHVALEEYWFDTPGSATTFFNGLPKLGSLLWQGSAGSYAVAGVPKLIFEKDTNRL
ncbi:uncharacterized protein ColSpa_07773 [Colletotrichum spaethianum]|uniref:Uncharacterized protein n=1 Tax=Colletotrichum spaethianum TaxID=700344 RepID=A0AA37P8G8_9PEZI|nr:uncharacterized protein ColSpa_07773 [Colletotrichum spaethianum]GKT47592.1 hypothetical protein ColSpa_07773 [Colletotrichum spaethianum]